MLFHLFAYAVPTAHKTHPKIIFFAYIISRKILQIVKL